MDIEQGATRKMHQCAIYPKSLPTVQASVTPLWYIRSGATLFPVVDVLHGALVLAVFCCFSWKRTLRSIIADLAFPSTTKGSLNAASSDLSVLACNDTMWCTLLPVENFSCFHPIKRSLCNALLSFRTSRIRLNLDETFATAFACTR